MATSTLTSPDSLLNSRVPAPWWARLIPEVRWAALAVVLFAVGGVLQLAGAPAATWWTAYLLCYAAGGWEPGLAGLQALREKTLDVDLLMIVAAIVAAGIGQILDGALLIIIFATSGALEAVATKRTRDSVGALLDLAPEQATRLESTGLEVVVPAASLIVGDVIRVRPGERIGADGSVADGSSDVDQAPITGESMPVVKHAGSPVYAGTMNGTGSLLVTVTSTAGESVVARIVAMVDEASQTKAATQLFIEKIEQRYSVGMVTATLALFFIPLAFGAELDATLLRAITFMIVASPCAVVLATMPPLLSSIANAGRHGVLVKSAVVMEQLGHTDTVAFDKTGTLTLGTPRVTTIDHASTSTLTEREVLRIAAAAERPSQHPLAAAIVEAASRIGIDSIPGASNFTSTPGRGVSAIVEGHTIEVSTPGSFTPTDFHPDLGEKVRQREEEGHTAVIFSIDGVAHAVISLSDELRPEAPEAVRALGRLLTHPPVLLTGDNASTAAQLASQVGIHDVRAGLLPQDKVTAVADLQATGRKVLLIGDGINDAPAMATAHLGIAMGAHGSDLALQTADAVIVRDDLNTIANVIALARRARRVVIANLVIAATVITALVAWDLIGTLPLPLGVAGHEGSTVIVGLNGLRLLRRGAWKGAPRQLG